MPVYYFHHSRNGIRRALGIVSSILLGLTASASCAAEDTPTGMTIAKDGKAMATIVISDEASSIVVDGVKDLQRCIEKMSGAKVPIETSVPA